MVVSLGINEHQYLCDEVKTDNASLYDSKWDLIMITWAALIVLQGVKGGYGEADDLPAIRVHLDILRNNNEPGPSLCSRLADRLETSIQDTQNDIDRSVRPEPADCHDAFGYDWSLFDASSLQGVNDFWNVTESDRQLGRNDYYS